MIPDSRRLPQPVQGPAAGGPDAAGGNPGALGDLGIRPGRVRSEQHQQLTLPRWQLGQPSEQRRMPVGP